MKDFKGTKGKWELNPLVDPTKPRYWCLYVDEPVKHIGIIHVQDLLIEEAKANALLIAAAPELLESLSKLVEMLRSPCVIDKEDFLAELDQETEKAKSIINKALGKEDENV